MYIIFVLFHITRYLNVVIQVNQNENLVKNMDVLVDNYLDLTVLVYP